MNGHRVFRFCFVIQFVGNMDDIDWEQIFQVGEEVKISYHGKKHSAGNRNNDQSMLYSQKMVLHTADIGFLDGRN